LAALARGRAGGTVDVDAALADVRARLTEAVEQAGRDPFGSAVLLDEGDVSARLFGLITMAVRYRQVTGDGRFDGFALAQTGWAFGANAWGVSLVVGAGATFPRCVHHQIANLAGPGVTLAGAVVGGPTDAAEFDDLAAAPGTRSCPARPDDGFARFDGHGARYVDDVAAWPSVEPAIDMTSSGLLALTLLALP
jgi:hypothetical protein